MLEILVIWWVSGAFAKRAVAKGRPGWQGRVPVIVGWFAGEIIGAIIGISQGETDELYGSMLLMAFIGLGIGIAIAMALPAKQGAYLPQAGAGGYPPVPSYAPQPGYAPTGYVPAPPQAAPPGSPNYAMPQPNAAPNYAVPAAPNYAVPAAPVPPVPSAAPAPRQAGFCTECGKNVWLGEGGCCEHGHPAQMVRDVYFA